MIIIGGTYDEICFEPRWEEKFGSGLRACTVINKLDSLVPIDFFTFGDADTELYLTQLKSIFPTINSIVAPIPKSVSFYYDHPLITPRIHPRLDTINKSANHIDVAGDHILYFGLIEGTAKARAKKLVYDPQSPSNPIPFSKTESQTDELAIVINYNEASRMADSRDLTAIKDYFLNGEKAQVLILKMGAKGALVIDSNSEDVSIPVYETSSVWPIGSGDVFASSFAFHWFAGLTPEASALKASLLTAVYCSTKVVDLSFDTSKLLPLIIANYPSGQIYLAGPFFTYAERWLIDQIRTCLKESHLNVFSPWHDIGHGIASEVVLKDIEALKTCKLVFAVIDGLDSGTLFEVGYAVSNNIPVIAYVENETEESVKMLEGTGCILEKDLTTAIYKSLWILSKND